MTKTNNEHKPQNLLVPEEYMEELETAVIDVLKYLDSRQDAEYDSAAERYVPNEAMRLHTALNAIRGKVW